jgi:hypothetical protein
MNLDILTDGVPDAKPWLNIVCNTLTANNIITPVVPVPRQVFQLGTQIGSTFPLVTTTTPCNIDIITNPNTQLVTNRYIAPSNQYLFVTIQYVLDAIAGGGQTDINVLVGGIRSQVVSRAQVNSGGVGQISGTCSGILVLNAGSAVSLEFNNAGYGAGWTYRDFYFTGFVVGTF